MQNVTLGRELRARALSACVVSATPRDRRGANFAAPAPMTGMSTSRQPGPEQGLDRLVAALVSWGATASRIVTRLESCRGSGASHAHGFTVEAFSSYVADLAGPVVARRVLDLEQIAEVIEAIDSEVFEQTLLVPPPQPNRAERRRRRRPC